MPVTGETAGAIEQQAVSAREGLGVNKEPRERTAKTMPLKVYAYKNCGTCRRALQWLDTRGIAYAEVPIRETPPTVAELKRVLNSVGGDLRRLFNTSGGDYKSLDMKTRLPTISEAEALALLAENGNLIKRPVVIGPGIALVGFREDEWEAALGK